MKDERSIERALLRMLFGFGSAELFEIVDEDGFRKPVIKTRHKNNPGPNREVWEVEIDWRLFNKWFGEKREEEDED